MKRKEWLAVGGSSGCCYSLECCGSLELFGQVLYYYGSDLLGMGWEVGQGGRDWVGVVAFDCVGDRGGLESMG